MAESNIERPRQGQALLLYGEGLLGMSDDALARLGGFLKTAGVSYELVDEGQVHEAVAEDVPITHQDCLNFAEQSGYYAPGNVTKTWNLLTGNGRYLQVVTDTRKRLPRNEKDRIIYRRMAPWQIDLVYDENSVSRNGLYTASLDDSFATLPRGFGPQSVRFVNDILSATDPSRKKK